MSLWASIVRGEHWLERLFGLHPPPDPVDEDAPTVATRAEGPARPGVLAAAAPPSSLAPLERGEATADDPIVGPAYSFLRRADLTWGPEARRALLDVQRAVGLDPKVGGLLAVMWHESGGDPGAPKEAKGLPRGGLIQLTVGANLPGYTTPEAVWGVRSMSAADQLRSVVLPYYKRLFPVGAGNTQDGVSLLRRNFLPSVAAQSTSYVLGVKEGAKGPDGEDASDRIPGGLTRGAIYKSNPGFDRQGRGFFTWADVDGDAHNAIAAGQKAGGWLTVSGKLVPFSSASSSSSASTSAPSASSSRADVPLSGAPRTDPHAMLAAWRSGEADPIRWERVTLPGGIVALTTGEPLAVGGMPRVLPFEDLLQIAVDAGALPLTAVISDARWEQATDKRIVPAVPSPDGAHFNDPDQNAKFLAMRGPNGSSGLRAGDHKEMVLAPGMAQDGPNSMVFYDWRRPDGSVVQKGGKSPHNKKWIEYDSLGNLVARQAFDASGNAIDLLDVIAAGGALGGPLPAWQVAQLRGSAPLGPPRSTFGGGAALAALEQGLERAGAGLSGG